MQDLADAFDTIQNMKLGIVPFDAKNLNLSSALQNMYDFAKSSNAVKEAQKIMGEEVYKTSRASSSKPLRHSRRKASWIPSNA